MTSRRLRFARSLLLLLDGARPMSISYFLNAPAGGAESPSGDEAAMVELSDRLAATPRLLLAELHRPAHVETYHRDGAAPRISLRLEFPCIEALEAQLRTGAYLHALLTGDLWREVAGGAIANVTQQAMLTRHFKSLPRLERTTAPQAASYLVHYPGEADDVHAWLAYYMEHHPQIMCTYPGVRQVAVFTRVDWCDALPFERVHHMQRNQLAFDDRDALMLALDSPVRALMRADNAQFPPFSAPAKHYAVRSTYVDLRPIG